MGCGGLGLGKEIVSSTIEEVARQRKRKEGRGC